LICRVIRACRTGGTRLWCYRRAPGDANSCSRLVSYLREAALFFDGRTDATASGDDPAKRDTKRVGDISEARVLLALTGAGYRVSKPFGEN